MRGWEGRGNVPAALTQMGPSPPYPDLQGLLEEGVAYAKSVALSHSLSTAWFVFHLDIQAEDTAPSKMFSLCLMHDLQLK